MTWAKTDRDVSSRACRSQAGRDVLRKGCEVMERHVRDSQSTFKGAGCVQSTLTAQLTSTINFTNCPVTQGKGQELAVIGPMHSASRTMEKVCGWWAAIVPTLIKGLNSSAADAARV